MSPPLLGVEGEGQSDGSIVALHCILQNGSGLKERNYLNLPDSSEELNFSDDNKINLNLKATELRLGLPGSQSPEREPDLCLRNSAKLDEKPLFPLLPSKDGICLLSQKYGLSGNKRGFSDTMDGSTEMKGFVFTEGKWMFHADSESVQAVGKFSGNPGANIIQSSRHSATQPPKMKEGPPKALQDQPRVTIGITQNQITASNNSNSAPSAKAQVVGWPPLKTFRKNSLATSSKNSEEVDGKQGPDALFVKVSMDGAPFLRKVDLKHYSVYEELSTALEKMFSCFTISKCGSHGAPGKEMLSESKLRDLLHGSEYVLAYEDKDGDWMLIGDVPWEMFIDSCKRLKIMKSSDAYGLAPRVVEKSKAKN